MKPVFALYGEVTQDRRGSLICRVNGSAEKPGVMLAAHMDEVGFVVKQITDSGFIRFLQVGDWDNQHLMGQHVHIDTKNDKVIGTIAGKPTFLMDQQEKSRVQDKAEMFVDIGATSKKEVEAAGITLGDPIVPVSGRSSSSSGGTTCEESGRKGAEARWGETSGQGNESSGRSGTSSEREYGSSGSNRGNPDQCRDEEGRFTECEEGGFSSSRSSSKNY